MANEFKLDETALKNISDIIADTNSFSKSELKHMLKIAGIEAIEDQSRFINGVHLFNSSNKRTWFYDCITNQCKKDSSYNCIYIFLNKNISPKNFINCPEKFKFYQTKLNKILRFYGYELSKDGEILIVDKISNLDECNNLFNNLNEELAKRKINGNIKKYCTNDILKNDYYNVIVESTKGLCERIREITGERIDGVKLIQNVFSTDNPKIVLNNLEDENDKNEFNGLKQIMCGCFALFRNTRCHTLKIKWNENLETTMNILNILSFCYDYLDKCYPMPKIMNRKIN